MKKLIAAAGFAALVAAVPSVGMAQDKKEASPHTFTGNLNLVSEYRYRGISQTNKQPAIQGGIDFAMKNGLYLGNWNSNVSSGAGFAEGNLEMDFYGGYKGTISGDLGFDVGLLQYYYPGTKNTAAVPFPAGIDKADTLELYGALTWKWLSAKYSYSLNKETFGVKDSDGSSYLDLSANFPVTDSLNLIAHYGIQKYEGAGGACGAGVSNDTCASYKDWKVGATYALPQSFSIGGYWTGTDMTTAQKAFYTNGASSKMIGKDTFTVFVSKTF